MPAHLTPSGEFTVRIERGAVASVSDLPGFSRDFDCFDSENQWDGKVVFVVF